VGEGEEEDVGARERTKGQLRASWCAFIGRGGERGLRLEVMASMAMAAGGLQCIQGRGLNGEETEGVKEGGGGRWF
jgi:hypothetical protein